MVDIVLTDRKMEKKWYPEPATLAPINDWPPRPAKMLKWLFGFPGYLWPENLFVLGVTFVTWTFLTPELAAMKFFELWWVVLLLARNLGIILVLYGGAHLYFYIFEAQGDATKFTSQPLARGNSRFLFNDQVRDNMFHTLAYGVPILTGYEAVTYWAFANGYLGLIDLGSTPVLFWAWFCFLVFVTPVIYSVHFYFAHRLLHTKPLYKRVHSLHHRNVVVGPWAGLDMHPVEQVLYFSVVVVQWLVALHPVNALLQIQHAAISPVKGHLGFERVVVGNKDGINLGGYFHYLHHRYFECNYGTGIVGLDNFFGTFHDGTDEAHRRIREHIRLKRKTVS